MNPSLVYEYAQSAAFMAMGYAKVSAVTTPNGAGWGQLETISHLTSQALRLEMLYEAMDEDLRDSGPGVWLYEVSEPFGEWFASRTLNGGVPDTKEMDKVMLDIMADFYTQCDGHLKQDNKDRLLMYLRILLETVK